MRSRRDAKLVDPARGYALTSSNTIRHKRPFCLFPNTHIPQTCDRYGNRYERVALR